MGPINRRPINRDPIDRAMQGTPSRQKAAPYLSFLTNAQRPDRLPQAAVSQRWRVTGYHL